MNTCLEGSNPSFSVESPADSGAFARPGSSGAEELAETGRPVSRVSPFVTRTCRKVIAMRWSPDLDIKVWQAALRSKGARSA